MIGRIALCADQESLAHPESLGLADVNWAGLPWLQTYSRGAAIRSALVEGALFDEIWVVSVEDLPIINLAAALRKDGFQGLICLVTDEASGSTLSRGAAAGVSEIYAPERFVQRFSVEAARRRRMEEVADRLTVPALDRVPLEERVPNVAEGVAPATQETAVSGGAPTRKSALRMSGNPRAGARKGSATLSMRAQPLGSGQLVAVVGASGGVGKSAVAACLAVAAAQSGKALILDGDLQFGCLHRMFGDAHPVTFDDAAVDEGVLGRLASAVERGKPALLAAPKRLEHSESLTGSIPTLAAAATELFDVVIADTGGSWSEAHAALMEMATCTLFVIDQRTESVHACQHALELCQRMGLATGSFTFALNRCSKDAPFTSADVSYALDGAHVHALQDGGFEVEELLGSGMALSLASSSNALVNSVEALGAQMLPAHISGNGGSAEQRAPALLRHLGQRRRRQRRRQRKEDGIVVKAGPPHPEFESARHAWESLR